MPPADPVPPAKPAAPAHLHRADLRGASRLVIAATLGLTDLVENLHRTVARVAPPLGAPTREPTTGVTGLVYRSVRGVTRLVGGSLEVLLRQLEPLLGPHTTLPTAQRTALLAALNGVLGDRMAATANPLALPFQVLHAGVPIHAPPAGANGRVLVLVHGLCMSAAQWQRKGHDHGAALAAATDCTVLRVQYNSGLHVSANGLLLADCLRDLHARWPVPVQAWVLLGHSMGGLVARSACEQGRQRDDAWLQVLRALICLGTPHHGAPLERGGHWIDAVLEASPYTAAFAQLGRVRSAGITDLRHGSLLEADWRGAARVAHRDPRTPVPLPVGVDCGAIAGVLEGKAGAALGDGLVPLDSALGRHRQAQRRLDFPAERQWVAPGVGHLGLLDSAAVFERLRTWLGPHLTAPPG